MATQLPDYLESGRQAGPARIYDNIQATMPAVTLPIIEMELWNTVEEFALRSTYFRDRVDWTMAPDVRTYDFNPYGNNMIAFTILKVYGLSYWQALPPAVLQDDSYAITGQRNGNALLALKPISFNCLPPVLWDRWFECMMDGVRGRLMSQPAKPYASPQMAEYHMKRFRVGLNLARAEAEQRYSGQTTFRFPYFAQGKRKQ
jgi:hypothetical protein